MTKIEIGAKAPNFTLPTLDGEVTLNDLIAQHKNGLIVYFYPRANTPGCTKQACDFRDSLASLQTHGYGVIGISPDKLPALEKFTTNQQINFPLASDPEHKVLEAWGAWGEKQNYGRKTVGVIRSTIILATDGTITHALYNVKATGHGARIKKILNLA